MLHRHGDADLLLLDLGLADGDGLDVLRRLRGATDVPVIVVTARGDERTTVRALALGADDYLVKPVRRHELLARIAAVARRHRGAGQRCDTVTVGELEVDLATRRATARGEELALTATEFAVLAVGDPGQRSRRGSQGRPAVLDPRCGTRRCAADGLGRGGAALDRMGAAPGAGTRRGSKRVPAAT